MEARKIIITGGATRIGAAIAEKLSGPSKIIIIHYNKSKSKAERLKKKLQKFGTTVHLVKGDLSKEKDIHKIIYEIKEMYKVGYMDWEYFEDKIQKTIFNRTFPETCTRKKWTYLKRKEIYECINKRNLGKTKHQKNKSHYEKNKENQKFIYNLNRKQCLRDIKKNNKRPSQKTIDKYKLTENEISLSCIKLN